MSPGRQKAGGWGTLPCVTAGCPGLTCGLVRADLKALCLELQGLGGGEGGLWGLSGEWTDGTLQKWGTSLGVPGASPGRGGSV